MRHSTIIPLFLVSACALPPVSTGTASGTMPASTAPVPATTPSPRSDADYRRIEREVLAELNLVRGNPPAYAAKLEQMLPLFSGNLRRQPGSNVSIRTQEGAAAVREAIDVLRSQKPLPALTLSDGLSRAAGDLAADQARTGALGHTGSDGSSPGDRISRYGKWGYTYAENVDYGSFASGRDVVTDLIVDDGVRDRGHRRNIFDQNARVVGIRCGPHPRYVSTCVIDQAGSFSAR
jgi:uncharacterized protein YkwD